jgi:hypothetical protein
MMKIKENVVNSFDEGRNLDYCGNGTLGYVTCFPVADE